MSATTAAPTIISDRKRAANQANAKKSTGPRTAEGKAKVRMNALVHGLRAETIVLPTENQDEFEAMRAGWIEDWKPETETRLALVERAVAGAWRLRRCIKVEHDRLAEQMEQAVAAYDGRVMARVNDGLRLLSLNPPRGLAELRQEHAGVSALIRQWEALGEALTHHRQWSDGDQHSAMLNLLGFRFDAGADEVGDAALHSWRLLVKNNPEVGDCEIHIANEAEAAAIAEALTGFVADHVADLKIELTRYPDPELIRARVADSVAYDVSR